MSSLLLRAILGRPLPGRAFDFKSGAKRFYVSNVDGDNGRSGTTPSQAVKTITYALSLCESGRGYVIIAAPGTYAENVSVTKDYVSIVGATGGRYGWPDITGSAGIPLSAKAQGLYLEHLRIAAPSGQKACRLQGNGFVAHQCIFDGDGSDCLELLPDLDDDSYTASEGLLDDCWFRYGATGIRFKNPGPGVEGGVGPSDVVVRGCRFSEITSQEILDEDTAGSNDTCFLSCFVLGCYFLDADKAVRITLTNGGANTGIIAGNYFADDAALDATKIAIAAGIRFTGNYNDVGLVDGSTF